MVFNIREFPVTKSSKYTNSSTMRHCITSYKAILTSYTNPHWEFIYDTVRFINNRTQNHKRMPQCSDHNFPRQSKNNVQIIRLILTDESVCYC